MSSSFVVAVISPNRYIHEGISSALEGYPHAGTLWSVTDYPEPYRMASIREAQGGCVVLLDFSDLLRAKAIAAELDRAYPMAAVVAILPKSGGQQELLDLMQFGIREVVGMPLTAMDVARAVSRAGKKLQQRSGQIETGGDVVAFVPAKPGCGATTLASNTAAAAARISHQRLLLVDFDLRLGMTSFLFKLHSENSVLDALMRRKSLDITLWTGLICQRGMLDILGSAPAVFGRDIDEAGAVDILAFARGLYPTIITDLPGDMRTYELEILQKCREIFLVCSPDIGTLHLAKKKADLLRSYDLAHNVSVIVNRADRRGSMPASDIEDILQVPVRFRVSSAEKEIQEATQKGAAVDGKSPFAREIGNIAQRICQHDSPVREKQVKRRFIDYFSVTPLRGTTDVRH